MSRIRIYASLAIALAFLNLSPPAYAQSATEMKLAAAALAARHTQMNTARANLMQMQASLNPGDAHSALWIQMASTLVNDAALMVWNVGTLAQEIKHADDLIAVRDSFRGAASYLVDISDNELESINSNLVDLRSPAALAEATKIRDLTLEIRDIAKPFARKH